MIQQDIQVKIIELRRQRDKLNSRMYSARKRGKDTTELEQEINDIKNSIADLEEKKSTKTDKKTDSVIKKHTKKNKVEYESKPARKWKKSELESCRRSLQKYLDNNDWCDGYQFRSSEWMFIRALETKVIDNAVALKYVMQYKTSNHRVEKVMYKVFNPDNVQKVNDYINTVETWVMLNSGDKDSKSIVFGDRFSKVQFQKLEYEKQGWVIYR